jgi:hypothetical protein
VAQALTELLNDSAKATRMGTAARELAFAKHDLAVSSRTRQQSYAELLAHEAT